MYFCFLFQFPGIGSAERMEKVMEAYVQMGTTEQEGSAGQTDKAGQTEKNGLTANAAPTAENVCSSDLDNLRDVKERYEKLG